MRTPAISAAATEGASGVVTEERMVGASEECGGVPHQAIIARNRIRRAEGA